MKTINKYKQFKIKRKLALFQIATEHYKFHAHNINSKAPTPIVSRILNKIKTLFIFKVKGLKGK